MNDETKEAILDALEEFSPLPASLQPGDITRRTVMTMRNLSYNKAGRWLQSLVDAGKLVKLYATDEVTGKRVAIYRPA